MKRTYPKILRNRKARIERRLAPKNWEAQAQPMLRGGNLHYEIAQRTGAVGCGGLGAIHTLAQRLGLVAAYSGANRTAIPIHFGH